MIRLLLVLIALVLNSCAPRPSSSGGQDLGGGDTTPAELLQASEVEKIARLYDSRRTELFRAFQITGLISKRMLVIEPRLSSPIPDADRQSSLIHATLFNRMFRNPHQTYTLLSKVRTEFRTSGPCFDREGNPKSGSIYAKEGFHVCMSISRLQSNLRRDNAEIEILALYAHELSHLFETTESEAESLQKLILGLGPNFRRYFGFLFDSKSVIRDSLTKVLHDLNQLDLKQNDADLCAALPAAYQNLLQTFVSENLSSQRADLPVPSIAEFHAALALAAYTADFCTADDEPSKLWRWRKFSGASSRLLKELYPDPILLLPQANADQTLRYSQYLLADLATPYRVMSVRLGDRAALAANLQQLKSALSLALSVGD